MIAELPSLAALKDEHFGPILHVIRWKSGELDKVIDQINATGFGLTLGLQSRIDTVAEQVAARARVGNLYINRNQIGAVVESQPFGGEGLGGTGPKAGGPHYVARFATERVTCIDTTAAGGNATLDGGDRLDRGSDQLADAGGDRHRQRAPEEDPERRLADRRPPLRAPIAPSRARNSSEAAVTATIMVRPTGVRKATSKRQARPGGEGRRRRQRRLDRARRGDVADAEFVAGVGAERVLGHQLPRDLVGGRRRRRRAPDRSATVPGARTRAICSSSARSRARSACSVSDCELTETYSPAAIDIAPATSPAAPASMDLRLARRGGRDADDQAGGGDDAVIGAEHRGPKPADPLHQMPFDVRSHRLSPSP